MTLDAPQSAFRYRAFISYSHRDKVWADWLHKALETYAIPSRLVGQTTAAGVIPRRLAPIFRDRDELASATDLGGKVNGALAQSANLIVICSPRSATSRWVQEEVLAYKQLGRSEHIFCLIVDGEPNASDLPGREAEECFAHALRYRLGSDNALSHQRTEPIAADARPGQDGKSNAKLKLIAGLLDVGFDQLKQRELQRRNRRLAAVAALAVAVMAVTTTLAIMALIARHAAVVASQAAVRRQKQAESLVNFMLGDLNDKLAQVSRLDILESVDDHAMRYFQSLPTTDVTDEALAQRAKALEKIGSVRMDQGHLPAAMASYQAALKLAAKLAEAAPTDTSRQITYAEIWAFIGMTHWTQGQLDDAQRSFESAQHILQRSEQDAASSAPLKLQLTMIDNNIGHVLEARGRFDEAALQYQSMLLLCQTMLAAQPGNSEWTARLGIAHNNLGKLALQRGDLATAIAQYSADDRIESELAARDPKNNDQQESMLIVHAILGRTLALAGDIESGARDLQQAVEIAARLKAVDPSNTSFQEDFAHCASQLSRLQRLSNDLPAANKSITQSLATYAALTKQDPTNNQWQREFAEAQIEQSEQWRTAGRADLARKLLQSALQILDPQLAGQPDDRVITLAVVRAKVSLAAATDDQQVARQLRAGAMSTMLSTKSGKDDPRLLALEVETLLALDRKTDARSSIQKLWNTGYRDQEFVTLLQRKRIDFPLNETFQQKLTATIGDHNSH
jgi:tetratricopeptide (TPR) repeat protein